MRHLIHAGTNTTPKFVKHKATQNEITREDIGTSPHIQMISPKGPMQGWDSPVTSPPHTPRLDIPSYFTTDYQNSRKALNLPEAVPYQGPLEDEDPLPPHLTPNQPEWGVISSRKSPSFQLMNYLESMCMDITPPGLYH